MTTTPRTLAARCPIVWFDLETGGLDEKIHDILEIGAIRTNPITGEELARLHLYVLPELGPVPDDARAINGYSEAGWAAHDAIPLSGALLLLGNFLEGAQIAGSTPAFDLRFTTAGFARHGLSMPRLGTHRMIDTSALALPLLEAGEIERTGLDELARYFRIPGIGHRAINDAERARAAYRCLSDIYRPAVEAYAAQRREHSQCTA